MAKTQPEPVRDQKKDHLLTPENCAVVLIDYQPEQYRTVTSATKDEINLNVVALCRLAKADDVPVIVSTVGVDMGVNTGMDEEIMVELPGTEEIDRTNVNSWEDEDFRKAVEATGRKKTVIAGLWNRGVPDLPDARHAGRRLRGLSRRRCGRRHIPVAHDRALDRMIHAGARPVTAISFGSELMRNWARDSAP